MTIKRAIAADLQRKITPGQKNILVALRVAGRPMPLHDLTEAIGYQRGSYEAVARMCRWLVDKGVLRLSYERVRCGLRVNRTRVYALGKLA